MLKSIQKRLKNRKGFTLVELIVVIAIVAILAAIAVPRMLGFTDRAEQQADNSVAAQAKNAVALLWANKEIVVDDGTASNAGAGFIIQADGTLKTQTAIANIPTPDTGAKVELLLKDVIDDMELKNTNREIVVCIDEEGKVKAEVQAKNTGLPTNIITWLDK